MNPGMVLYFRDLESLRKALKKTDENGNPVVTKEQIADLIFGLMDYAQKGEEPERLSPSCQMAFDFMIQKLDRDIAKYESCVTNGRKGGRPKNPEKPNETQRNPTKPSKTQVNPENQNENEYVNENENVNVFFKEDAQKEKRGCKPPTLEEVKEYVRTAGLETDAEAFFDYFSSCGWMRGVNPMTDWQAACRSWKNNRGKQIIPITAKRGSVYNYQERQEEPTSNIDQQMEEFMRQQEAAR